MIYRRIDDDYLDPLAYETAKLALSRFVTIDEGSQHFHKLLNAWG